MDQDDLSSLAQWEVDWLIKFNVAKCHSMRVISSATFFFTKQVRSAKYLGLTITDNLEWGQHVSERSCKATKTLGFLRRNLALAPRHTKEVAYKTLVRHKLEYAAPICIPIMTLGQIRWGKCRGQQPDGPADNEGT